VGYLFSQPVPNITTVVNDANNTAWSGLAPMPPGPPPRVSLDVWQPYKDTLRPPASRATSPSLKPTAGNGTYVNGTNLTVVGPRYVNGTLVAPPTVTSNVTYTFSGENGTQAAQPNINITFPNGTQSARQRRLQQTLNVGSAIVWQSTFDDQLALVTLPAVGASNVKTIKIWGTSTENLLNVAEVQALGPDGTNYAAAANGATSAGSSGYSGDMYPSVSHSSPSPSPLLLEFYY
jgi:hypothetical protein